MRPTQIFKKSAHFPLPTHHTAFALIKSGRRSRFLDIFLVSWLFFSMVYIFAYECNLRAYLMAVDFEEPIETDQERGELLDRV